jgi:hypothetical protein
VSVVSLPQVMDATSEANNNRRRVAESGHISTDIYFTYRYFMSDLCTDVLGIPESWMQRLKLMITAEEAQNPDTLSSNFTYFMSDLCTRHPRVMDATAQADDNGRGGAESGQCRESGSDLPLDRLPSG